MKTPEEVIDSAIDFIERAADHGHTFEVCWNPDYGCPTCDSKYRIEELKELRAALGHQVDA